MNTNLFEKRGYFFAAIVDTIDNKRNCQFIFTTSFLVCKCISDAARMILVTKKSKSTNICYKIIIIIYIFCVQFQLMICKIPCCKTDRFSNNEVAKQINSLLHFINQYLNQKSLIRK